MKAIFMPILAVLCFVSAISCKSDDDAGNPPVTNADLIVGTWNMTDNKVENGNATVDYQGNTVNANFSWTGNDYNYALVFTEDDNVSESGSFDLDVTASLIGISEEQEVPLRVENNIDVLISGTYNISENTLSSMNNGQNVIVQIQELTDTTLVISFDLATLSPAQLEGIAEDPTGTNVITFTKN